LVVVCALAAACGSEQELRYTSTLEAETSGLALSERGDAAHAAMSGTTCTIDPEFGCPIADADLPSAEEAVLDHRDGITLGRSPRGLHKVDADGWRRTDDLAIDGLKTAKLVDGGTAMLWGDTDQCWTQRGDGDAIEVPGAACADGAAVEVDRRRGTLFVASDLGLVTVDDAGSQTLARIDEDLVSWDASLRQLYVAHEGSSLVRAITRRGEEVWTYETEGTVRSIASRGKHGEVLILSRGADGYGTIHRVDGSNGNDQGSTEVPVSDADLEVSADGGAVALVCTSEVHFYAFERDDADTGTITRDPPNCIQPQRTIQD